MTVVADNPAVVGFTQDETAWRDLAGYGDVTAWIDCDSVVQPGFVQLVLEASPTRDEDLFSPIVSPIALSAGGLTLNRSVRSATTTSLPRWLRWRLQLLSGAASGSWGATFRIRLAPVRGLFFAPTDIPGCAMWNRADLGIATVGTTSSVQMWSNQVRGLLPDFTASSGSYPTLMTTGINNLPALSGNGTTQFMVTSAATLGPDATLAMVVQPSGASEPTNSRILETNFGTSFYVGTGNDSPSTNYKLIVANGSPPFGTAAGGIIAAQPTIVAATFNSATSTGTIIESNAANGYDFTSSNAFGTPTATPLPIYLMSYMGSSNFWSGSVAEVVIYNRLLQSNELTRLLRYLGGRYGIAVP